MSREKDLELLRETLPEYEIEPYTDWKPGDPVKNTGDMLARQEYEEEQVKRGELPFGDRTCVTFEGQVKDIAFTAPEIIDWDKTKEMHDG